MFESDNEMGDAVMKEEEESKDNENEEKLRKAAEKLSQAFTSVM